MFKKVTLSIFLILFSNISFAGVKAYLNQTTVYEGDPVQLTVESDRKVSHKPDISVLRKDFEIKGTSEGTSFSMVNGNSSYSQTWTITLQPKRKGEINIPAIYLGAESTTPLKLIVADITPEALSKSREHVTLEATAGIGKSLPYVQQQIPYTLKLYTNDSIHEGDIFAPAVENAVVEQISKDKQYSITRNGKKFNVLERHYVISPEKSGKLVIPPAIFKGKQRQPREQQRRPRDNFFNDPFFNDPFFGNLMREPGKSITSRSDSIEVDVQPIPSNYKGKNWLPAEDLVVTDSWNKNVPVFRVGEPVMRTLTLQTKGLTGAQIPEFSVDKPEQIRVYPDQSKNETKTDGMTVFGLRQQQTSYIPNVAGKMKIPEFRVDWWNVVSKTQESFVIPAREVQVLAGVGGNQATPSPEPAVVEQATAENSQETAETAKEANQPEKPISSDEANKNYLLWLLLFLGIIAAGAVYFWRRKAPEKTVPTAKKKPVKVNTKHLLDQLQQACTSNNKELSAKYLLQLAEAEWPRNPPKNLGALAERLEKGVDEVKNLDRSLYAKNSESWNGLALWGMLKNGLSTKVSNRKPRTSSDDITGSLYPDRA